MNYLIEINEKDKNHQVTCPLCMQTIKSNKFTLTHRAVKFLMVLGKLSKKDDGSYDYVKYEDVRLLTKQAFNVNFTSYGLLTKKPWDFIEARKDTNDKIRRDGYFKLTNTGYNFLRGKISVPETLWIQRNRVIKVSNKMINIATAKVVDFHSCVELLKSF
jgi:hypothetical protein